ncbi:MAG: sensor histidine kinase [Ignavibacteria bacterium]|jgi:signal transduction histidine kinase/Tfp pilus assembly protein PilF|nr:sensor histidine kinase [Ignavibacteria bacterium]MCU7502853.1 sensor histidine kinase [Ignavibacteria bacterium]MCU7515653.1 sensor histidine kinase [Ignavibacteria bacterium]
MKPSTLTLITAFLCSLSCTVFALNQPDSLEAKISAKTGTEKVDAMLGLADYYKNLNPQKGLQIASRALKMSEGINYAKGLAGSYTNLGEIYTNLSDYHTALRYHKKALEIRNSMHDMHGVAASLNSIGGLLEHLGNYDQAMKNYYRAIDIEEANSDLKELSTSYSLVATLHYILQDYPRALEYCHRAIRIREKSKNAEGLSNSYELMGLINYDLKKFDESLKFNLLSLNVKRELNDKIGVAEVYHNIGMVYRLLNKFDIAINYFTKALRLREELGEKRGIASTLTSLGELYIVLGRYQLALNNFLRSREIRQEIKDKRGLTRSYFYLSTVYEKLGNYKKAYENQSLFFAYKDSLNKAQTLQKLTSMDMQYKNEKKDKEIALLQKDNIIQKTVRNSLIAGFILVTIIAVGSLAAYRSKKRTNLLLEEKNREISSHHEELKRLNDELKVSNATKDKFFSIIAHDLRSPFFGFLGISDELEKNAENLDSKEISEYAGILNQSAKKIFNLVNNLLEWSLLQSCRINPELVRLNLHDEVENIKGLFLSSSLNKSITIVNKVDSYSLAVADKKMVETVLRNLISNAIKFTGTGGSISIGSQTKGEFLEISVTDTGIGIKEEVKEKLFSIDSAHSEKGTRGEAGSGLGLILCKELVEKNGGEISVESQPDKGTTFSFTLPSLMEEAVQS